MVQSFDNNPVMSVMGKQRHSELIQWAQTLQNSRHNLSISEEPHTLVHDNQFRLDQQGVFIAHNIRWINLQVQFRDATLFTVYVQSNAWNTSVIRRGSVWEAVKKGAHKGILEQTVFAGRSPKPQAKGEATKNMAVQTKRCSPRELVEADIVTKL